jgi:hypothetical protein
VLSPGWWERRQGQGQGDIVIGHVSWGTYSGVGWYLFIRFHPHHPIDLLFSSKLYVVVSMARMKDSHSNPLFEVKYLSWTDFMNGLIRCESPSQEMNDLLDWCDCFMGGVDLTVDYL